MNAGAYRGGLTLLAALAVYFTHHTILYGEFAWKGIGQFLGLWFLYYLALMVLFGIIVAGMAVTAKHLFEDYEKPSLEPSYATVFGSMGALITSGVMLFLYYYQA